MKQTKWAMTTIALLGVIIGMGISQATSQAGATDPSLYTLRTISLNVRQLNQRDANNVATLRAISWNTGESCEADKGFGCKTLGYSRAARSSGAPVAQASCVNASTPGGTKCLQVGQFCSHKAGYAAAYRKAGFKCKANGHLAYR